ncbi:type II secretion system F family protein [Agilicoccus flavus]|uniref:type II secretion system F family protein n=1 Tax=Agilicoccus flavus TaxID=2775968 RepID=UPI001CF6C534|nr:type II secretion system F family protein [Agilicoccus flavus]
MSPRLVVALLLAAAVLAWPSSRVGAIAERLLPRRRRAGRVPAVRVADAMDLLALVLRSGCGVVEALEAVGRATPDECGAHLLSVAAARRWGLDEAQAWQAVPAAWAPAAQALALAARVGAAPAELLERAADDVRRREASRLELATAALGVRVVLPLGLTFLPAFLLTTVAPIVVALTGDLLGS